MCSGLLEWFNNTAVDALHGPAYKWIPLAVSVAQKYFESTWKNIGFNSIRKERKPHWEGWFWLWMDISWKNIVIIDDSITSGWTVKSTASKIDAIWGKLVWGIFIIDREEVQEPNDRKTAKDLLEESGIKVATLLSYSVIRAAISKWVLGNREIGKAMDDYYRIYWPKWSVIPSN